MKPNKTTFATLLFAAILSFGMGCDPEIVIPPPIPPEIPPGGPEEPTPDPKTAYEFFGEQFAAGSTGEWTTADGTHTVTFDEGSLELDDETRVIVCTPDAWPAVDVEDGAWHIDGIDTDIDFDPDAASEQIVAVVYDTEGIYVRLSTGKMFYFHEGRTLDVGCFRFEKALNPSLADDVICTVDGAAISGDLGLVAPGTELIPTFGSRGDMGVEGSDQALTSSVSSVTFTGEELRFWLAKDGDRVSYSVALEYENIDIPTIAAVPILRINTKGQGAPTSKEDYITVEMTIEDPDMAYGDLATETVVTEIRGRGNSTWGMPKKPYKLKLDKKKRMFGMSDNKHWVLLANYSDKSLLRNSLAFKIGELAGMEWLPRWVPVELYMDGRYEGQYMLTEQIRTGDERIEMDLAGSGDNSGDALTGGYLFCIDEKDLDPGAGTPKVGFWYERQAHPDWGDRMPVAFDEPEDPTQAQVDYAKALFKQIDDAIYSGSLAEISELIDVESFIDYFLIHELAKDPDGNMRLSTYVAKPRGGKLYFPTVWDFDISFGNCDYGNGAFANPTVDWTVRGAPWYKELLRNEDFCALVTERWNELRPQLATLESHIRSWADGIEESQQRNFERWPILGVTVWPNWQAESRTTYQAEVDFLVDFINRRVEWLDRQINAGNHHW